MEIRAGCWEAWKAPVVNGGVVARAGGHRIDPLVLTQAMLESRGSWAHPDTIETVIHAALRLSQHGVHVTLDGAAFVPPRHTRAFGALQRLLAQRTQASR